jgi:hypothetical protein
MRAVDKRLGRVQQAIDASPICQATLRKEYKWFRCLGELPDDDRLAYEIVMQALRGGEEGHQRDATPYREREQPRDQWPPSVRGFLFDEALDANKLLRDLARSAIAMEVAWGGDVENPGFGARHGIPTYGCIALHVSGHRQKLKIAPYEAQATRLFIRNDNVCGRISEEASSWFPEFSKAMALFWHTGVLPDDELILDTVLIFVETNMLVAHRRGTDVTETMALLDAIARAKHDERDELLNELSAIAAAGGLPGSDSVGDDA